MPLNPEAKRKIIWGVDAFDPEQEKQTRVMQLLRILARDTGAQIQPVFVLTREYVYGGIPLSEEMIEVQTSKAEASLGKITRKANIPGLLPSCVIFQKSPRLRDAAATLSHYALSEKASMIVVATHGHRGLKRLFMGSFAETLMLTSPVPILTISPEIEAKLKLKQILFPTDLGTYAEACFAKALELTKELNARLMILHSAPIPGDHPIGRSIRAFKKQERQLPGEWHQEYSKRLDSLNTYLKRAEGQGAEAGIFLDVSGLGLTSVILSAVDRMKIDLIAMPAQSGGLRAVLTGSTTRQVARAAPCPVWILHEGPSVLRTRIAA